MSTTPLELVRSWLIAAADDRIASELEGIYEYTAAAIESRGPACWASGRCCNFDKAGHRLYATGLETAYTLHTIGGPLAPASARLTPEALAAAIERGGCPFQVKHLCGVHAIKPLGCRVYFCDRSAQRWQEDLSEAALARVRALHDRFSLEYRYGEWREMLGLFLES